MPTRYHISLPDAASARGGDPSTAFTAHGAEEYANQLQQAIATAHLFDRWRASQADPEGVDPAWGATDPAATVQGSQRDLHVELILVTALPGDIVRQRLRLLAGGGWQLRDVSAA